MTMTGRKFERTRKINSNSLEPFKPNSSLILLECLTRNPLKLGYVLFSTVTRTSSHSEGFVFLSNQSDKYILSALLRIVFSITKNVRLLSN